MPHYLLQRKPTLIRLEKRGQEVLSNFAVAKGIKREMPSPQKGYIDIGNQDKRFHYDMQQQQQQPQFYPNKQVGANRPEQVHSPNVSNVRGASVLYQMKVLPNGTLQQVTQL